jgi:dienelactone hydrolase
VPFERRRRCVTSCFLGLVGGTILLLAGCAGGGARHWLISEAAPAGFAPIMHPDASGRPLVLLRRGQAEQAVRVYLEGDGAAWPSRFRPPVDPTPDAATVMTMAAADPASAVAYVARPCQFLAEAQLAKCDPALWTRERFSERVVTMMDAALTQVRATLGAQRLHLVGYSGGGVIATLLAARRPDVGTLTTVAAPLRTGAWVQHHGISPLSGQDPDTISHLPMPAWHLVGADDRIVPPFIVEPFARRTGGQLVIVPDYGHQCCWARDWAELARNGMLQKNQHLLPHSER